jgi:hypothetical protein
LRSDSQRRRAALQRLSRVYRHPASYHPPHIVSPAPLLYHANVSKSEHLFYRLITVRSYFELSDSSF